MSQHHPYPDDSPEVQSVRRMVGDPLMLAYAWIEAYVENLNSMVQGDPHNYQGPITIDELIDTAYSHIESNTSWGGGYLSRGGTFEGIDVDPIFWEKLAVLKQIEIPQERRNNFFSCSC